MNYKYVLLLVIGWVVYLAAGGAIFHLTETKYEKEVIDTIFDAKQKFLSKCKRVVCDDDDDVCLVPSFTSQKRKRKRNENENENRNETKMRSLIPYSLLSRSISVSVNVLSVPL